MAFRGISKASGHAPAEPPNILEHRSTYCAKNFVPTFRGSTRKAPLNTALET